MARRYHNKMVPLTSEEDAAFHSVTSSWSKMCRAYALCASLVRPAPEDPVFLKLMATILYRCITTAARSWSNTTVPGANTHRASGWNCTAITPVRKNGTSPIRHSPIHWKTRCTPRTVPLPTFLFCWSISPARTVTAYAISICYVAGPGCGHRWCRSAPSMTTTNCHPTSLNCCRINPCTLA